MDGRTTTVTEYLDGFQYEDRLLEFFPTTEGYVRVTAASLNPNTPVYSFNYAYNYTDHLGNVRLTYAKDPQIGDLKVMEENHYYPYGLKHQNYGSAMSLDFQKQLDDWGVILAPVTNNPYKYKYNGKELQDELGLNRYGMDMRQYDPAIARWVVLDPVIHHSMSPYNAFDNNPVFWADPSGADGENSDTSTDSGGYDVQLAFGVMASDLQRVGAVDSYYYGDSYETNNNSKKNNSNDKKSSAAVEIADKKIEVSPKEWESENWKYFNVDDLEEANNKLGEYLDGSKLDNLLVILHGGYENAGNEEQAGIQVSSNGDRIELSNLNSDNPLVQNFLKLVSNVKEGGNVILGACEPGLSNQFSQTMHNLMNSSYNLYTNRDWSSFRLNGTDRNIFGPITNINNHKYGWSYLRSGDHNSEVQNINNVIIMINGSIKVKN